MAFLAKIFAMPKRAWVKRTVDVRRMALTLEGKGPDIRNSLSSTAERYGVPVSSPHEALDDALVTAQLFLVLATKLEERGYRRVGELLMLTWG